MLFKLILIKANIFVYYKDYKGPGDRQAGLAIIARLVSTSPGQSRGSSQQAKIRVTTRARINNQESESGQAGIRWQKSSKDQTLEIRSKVKSGITAR